MGAREKTGEESGLFRWCLLSTESRKALSCALNSLAAEAARLSARSREHMRSLSYCRRDLAGMLTRPAVCYSRGPVTARRRKLR